MGHEVSEARNNSNNGPEAGRDFPKKEKDSGSEPQILVSLCHVDSPDAEVRMKRALRLILRAGQGDKTSDQTETSQI